jgi:hypothetical protein
MVGDRRAAGNPDATLLQHKGARLIHKNAPSRFSDGHRSTLIGLRRHRFEIMSRGGGAFEAISKDRGRDGNRATGNFS